jgi:hypothetical protein
MRRLVLLLIISFCCISLYSQAVYDSIDFKKIRVNGIVLGTKKEELVKKFGEPQKIVTTESAPGKDNFSNYHYNKSTLRVSPASFFTGFKLTENDLVLRYEDDYIKVGDSLKEFALNFPQSFKAYSKDAGGKFKLRIKGGNSYIVFKTKDGIISEIEVKEELPQ